MPTSTENPIYNPAIDPTDIPLCDEMFDSCLGGDMDEESIVAAVAERVHSDYTMADGVKWVHVLSAVRAALRHYRSVMPYLAISQYPIAGLLHRPIEINWTAQDIAEEGLCDNVGEWPTSIVIIKTNAIGKPEVVGVYHDGKDYNRVI
jgi:hypothetical protein